MTCQVTDKGRYRIEMTLEEAIVLNFALGQLLENDQSLVFTAKAMRRSKPAEYGREFVRTYESTLRAHKRTAEAFDRALKVCTSETARRSTERANAVPNHPRPRHGKR